MIKYITKHKQYIILKKINNTYKNILICINPPEMELIKMKKAKKILIFLSAVLLVVIGNKKNSDFVAQNKEKNSKEVLDKEKATEVKGESSGVTTEPDGKERATASK